MRKAVLDASDQRARVGHLGGQVGDDGLRRVLIEIWRCWGWRCGLGHCGCSIVVYFFVLQV